MNKNYELGDIVQMKKTHACGTDRMEITRMGMDIRIRCVHCQHSILLPRFKFEKSLRAIVQKRSEEV